MLHAGEAPPAPRPLLIGASYVVDPAGRIEDPQRRGRLRGRRLEDLPRLVLLVACLQQFLKKFVAEGVW